DERGRARGVGGIRSVPGARRRTFARLHPVAGAARQGKAPPVSLLLDTCTLIWLVTGERKLPQRVAEAIANREVVLSAACAWEIAIKYAKGSLRLSQPPERLVPAVRERYG